MVLWGEVGGKAVHLVTIKSGTLEVDISSFGAGIVSTRVLVNEEWIDVVLGYESLEKYVVGKPNFGTTVGRCANRIAAGRFELDGVSCQLDTNNGSNHLHGGTDGFYRQVFTITAESSSYVTMRYSSPDGEMGYPGSVDVAVTYTVSGGELKVEYEGITDKPTLVSLTNHAYWNLKGHSAGDVLDHNLMVAGSRTTTVDEHLLITGELPSVKGTHLDFLDRPKLLREAVDNGGAIDVNYCLDASPSDSTEPAEKRMRPDLKLAACLVGPNGLEMEVWTDQPGLQVFTGSNIDPSNAKWWHGKGAVWQKFGAICLEPQLWPDAVHHETFKTSVLRPGEKYRACWKNIFSVK